MKKYIVEFVATVIFIFTILTVSAIWSAVLIPMTVGICLATLIYMGGPISGAHYNPAVTLAALFRKKITLKQAVGYVIMQLLGAGVAYFIYTKWLNLTHAQVQLAPSLKAVFVAEFLYTFTLVSTVLHTAMSKATAGNNYFGLAIGAVVMVGIASVGGISGGFFNPAVLLGLWLFGLPKLGWMTILGAHISASICAAIFHAITQEKIR